MKVTATICALLVTVPSVCVADESFYCGNWIASSAMSVAELLRALEEIVRPRLQSGASARPLNSSVRRQLCGRGG